MKFEFFPAIKIPAELLKDNKAATHTMRVTFDANDIDDRFNVNTSVAVTEELEANRAAGFDDYVRQRIAILDFCVYAVSCYKPESLSEKSQLVMASIQLLGLATKIEGYEHLNLRPEFIMACLQGLAILKPKSEEELTLIVRSMAETYYRKHDEAVRLFE